MRATAYSLVLLGFLAALSGCATKTYVNEQNDALGQRLSADLARVDSRLGERIGRNETGLASTNQLAQDALARAGEAHRLAQGKILYEATLTDDQVKFASGRAGLSNAAKQALDEVVNRIKAENKGVWIEIQGHTDKTGTKESNKVLGLHRAEAVREYLHAAGIPLHLLSVISYGDSQPATTERGRAANAQNRRVVLVVLA